MKFISILINWYKEYKRDFPWRKTQNFYYIWVCEIIFQQTRIAQGMEYYNRFLQAFPTIEDLANADEQEVLAVWQGLGYYSRARNIHYTAKQIVFKNKGILPKNYKELLQLKGIGSYTAAAIASICFQEKVPAIDGNALRVYARVLLSDKNIAETKTRDYFFDYIKPYLKSIHSGDYNQAIMELGALLCTPKNPSCEECPIQYYCLAYKKDRVEAYPVKINKIQVKNEFLEYYFYQNDNQEMAIVKRNTKGIWQNMYEFPTKNFLHLPIEKSYTLKQKLTHRNLEIKINIVSSLKDKNDIILKNSELKWVLISNYEKIPFPIVFSTFIQRYLEKML